MAETLWRPSVKAKAETLWKLTAKVEAETLWRRKVVKHMWALAGLATETH